LEGYAFLISFLEQIKFDGALPKIIFSNTNSFNINKIKSFFEDKDGSIFKILENEKNKNLIKNAQVRFSSKFGNSFSYEFSENDFKEIQICINDLRGLISKSKLIEENHKQRLLKRLERLQSELHKRMSDLDGVLNRSMQHMR